MEVNYTKGFVHYMAVLKEIETNYYKKKLSNIRDLMLQNPNKLIYKYKHQIILNRLENLLKTHEELKQLKKDLKKL